MLHPRLLPFLLAAPALAFGSQDVVAEAQGNPASTWGKHHGWLDWRGPAQCGWSNEKNVFDTVELDGKNHKWSYELSGRGTPVISNGRLFTLGYRGEGKDLQEILLCLDAKSGEFLWERAYSDFLSDIIYNRYAIGSPTVDPVTGNLFFMTTPGLLICLTPDGDEVWRHAMSEEYGRLTFPNGRIGAPVIEGELCIVHIISAHWGREEGPARDRFYAFDKRSGLHVWTCTPGGPPKDAPYSHPVVGWSGASRVLYAGTGCGRVVAIDAYTGDPLWAYVLATGGVNSSPVLHGDNLIAIHERENVDSSVIGRLVSLKTDLRPEEGQPGPAQMTRESENWRNDDVIAFTSSLVLVGNRVYSTTKHGELKCVDADSGQVLWHEKLAGEQIHASPLAADGKIYAPMNDGSFHVLRVSDEGAESLCKVQLAGNCIGAPSLYAGHMYVHTTEKLYCFADEERRATVPVPGPPRMRGTAGEAARLQIAPGDILLEVGQELVWRVQALDAAGRVVERAITAGVQADAPPTLAGNGRTWRATKPGMGVIRMTWNGLSDSARVRVVPALPMVENFDAIALERPDPEGGEAKVGGPPSHWIGAAKKFHVCELEGSQVLAKSLDNPLFQRATTLIGSSTMSDYTMQVDIRTDGSRRTLSNAGVVHQRYLIELKGNHQELEVTSNEERIKEKVPFKWKRGVWYTLKSRVDVDESGAGVVRAKVWPRDEEEPDAWTIEVEHTHAHTEGSPGLLGFAPQSRFHVYLDNLSVTPHE